MLTFPLAFLMGDIFSNWQPVDGIIATVSCFTAIVILFRYRNQTKCLILAGLLAGNGYSVVFMAKTMSWELDNKLENKAILIRGTIISLPITNQFGTHFLF